MALTKQDVQKSLHNIFNVDYNGAVDTADGVFVKLSQHALNHLGGSKQEELRRQLGLVVRSGGVLIKGETIESIRALHAQNVEDQQEAAHDKAAELSRQFYELLAEVNGLERRLELPETGLEDLKQHFDMLFDWNSHTERAVQLLEELKAKHEKVCGFLPQINQLRAIFPDERLRFTDTSVNALDSGWYVDFENISAVIKDPSVVEDLASAMDSLYGEYERLVSAAGYLLYDLYSTSPDEENFVIGSVDGKTPLDDYEAQEAFCQTFGLNSGGIQFYCSRNFYGGRTLAYGDIGRFHRLSISVGDGEYLYYPWISVDALLFMRSLVDRMKEAANQAP